MKRLIKAAANERDFIGKKLLMDCEIDLYGSNPTDYIDENIYYDLKEIANKDNIVIIPAGTKITNLEPGPQGSMDITVMYKGKERILCDRLVRIKDNELIDNLDNIVATL